MKTITISPTTDMWSLRKKELFNDSELSSTVRTAASAAVATANAASSVSLPGVTAETVSVSASEITTTELSLTARQTREQGTLAVVRSAAAESLSLESSAAITRGSVYVAPVAATKTPTPVISVKTELVASKQETVSVSAGTAVLLPYEMPRAEYMYGCTATTMAMIFAYYDRYGYTVNGQTYSAVNLIKGGTAELNSRGLDGDIYNMNSFNTLVGSATASRRHVSEFYEQTPETELKNTFVGNTNEIDQSRWDCLADYMGTNQFWRGNADTSSLVYLNATLGQIKQLSGTYTITYGDTTRDIPLYWVDYSYGLSLYVEDMGNYRLSDTLTATYNTDNNGGIFTFEMYKAEIDAGRAVHIGIEDHSMVGYGYDAATKEIIFDDTYESGKRMKWGGSYYYAGESRALQSISTIAFDTSYFKALPTVTGSLEYQQTRRDSSSKLENLTASAQKTATNQVLYQISGTTGGVLYLDVDNDNVFDSDEKSFTVGSFTQSDIDSGKVKFNFTTGSKTGNFTFKVANGADGDNGQYLWSSAYQYKILAKANPDPVTIHNPAVSGNQVTLTWDTESGLKYEVQYSLTEDFALFTQTTLTVGTWQLNQMADKFYYWRIRAVDSDKDVSDWTGGSFRVDTIAPGIPNAQAPQITDASALFQWTAVDDASSVSYEIEYSRNADFSDSKTKTVTDTKWLLSDLEDAVYYWRIRASDSAGNTGAWSPGGQFRIDTVTPDAVNVEAPRLYGTRVEFRWSEVSDISGVTYELEYATEADFSNAVRTTLDGKTKLAVNDIPEGQYYWRVRAVDGASNASSWSNGTSFLVDTIAPAIAQVFDAEYSDEKIVWHWSDAVEAGGLAYYELEYAATSDFADSVTVKLTDTAYTLNTPESQRYFWRLRAVDNAGNASRWQMGTPFKILTEAGSTPETAETIVFNRTHEEQLGGADLSDMFKITLEAGLYAISVNGVDTPLRAQVTLYDATGKKVLLSSNSNKSGSIQTGKIVLDAGAYYIKVNSTNGGKSEGLYGIKVTGETFAKANQADDDAMLNSPLVLIPGDRSQLAAVALMADEWVGTGDGVDYRRLKVEAAGKYDFTLTNLTNNAKLTVYNSAGKKLKTISVKPNTDKNVIAGLLLTAGTYYVSVEAPGAQKAQNTGYDLTMTGEVFAKANQADDDAMRTSPLVLIPGDQSQLAAAALMTDEWVGNSDGIDYRRLKVATAGKYDFTLTNLTNNAKLTVYNSAGKKLQTITVKPNSAKNVIAGLLLTAGTYYVSVEAPGAQKAQNTGYDLAMTGEVFNRGSNADDSFATAGALNTATGVQDGWVGFGDAIDYYKFSVTADNAGSYGFELAGLAKAATLAIYQEQTGKSPKQLKKAAIGKDGVAAIANLKLSTGTYFVAVTSADQGKGKQNTEYDLSIDLPEPTVPLQIVRAAATSSAVTLADLSTDGLNSSWGLDAALTSELSCASDLLSAAEEEYKRNGLLAAV